MTDRTPPPIPARVDLDEALSIGAIEHMIVTLLASLEAHQRGPNKCRDYALAKTRLEEASFWLAASNAPGRNS